VERLPDDHRPERVATGDRGKVVGARPDVRDVADPRGGSAAAPLVEHVRLRVGRDHLPHVRREPLGEDRRPAAEVEDPVRGAEREPGRHERGKITTDPVPMIGIESGGATVRAVRVDRHPIILATTTAATNRYRPVGDPGA
jgi:hypothetical protein